MRLPFGTCDRAPYLKRPGANVHMVNDGIIIINTCVVGIIIIVMLTLILKIYKDVKK